MRHRDIESTETSVNGIAENIVGAAIEEHGERGLGLESAFGACPAHELLLSQVSFNRQYAPPVRSNAVRLDSHAFVLKQGIRRMADWGFSAVSVSLW